jgi:hypothetical protein
MNAKSTDMKVIVIEFYFFRNLEKVGNKLLFLNNVLHFLLKYYFFENFIQKKEMNF